MRFFSLLAAVAFWSVLASSAPAAPEPWSQINVTGYNEDVVAENAPAASFTSADTDGVCNYLYAESFPGAVAGLPASRTLSNGTRSFQLRPYSESNGLLVRTGTPGALVLTTPGMFDKVGLLVMSASGSSQPLVKVNFMDGGFEVVALPSVADWYAETGGAFAGGFGRVHCDNSVGGATVSPSFFVRDIVLSPGNQTRKIVSLTIDNGSSGRLLVFAVDGQAHVPPVPMGSPLMLCGLILALLLSGSLLARRRLRQAGV